MADRRITPSVAAVYLIFLVGCVSQIAAPPSIDKREPAEFPGAYYRGLLAQGKPVFRVDPTSSLVVIEVRREGSLAQFGHDHVVASHDVAGSIAPDQGRADLWVPLDALVVDEPELRAEAGFITQPSPGDIAGTRRNMLEKILETDRHPYAVISVTEVGAGGSAKQLRVVITLHGMTRSLDTVAQFETSAAEALVTGTIAVDQSDFGIVPFSVFAGAIAVQDRLSIAFRLRAHRVEWSAGSDPTPALRSKPMRMSTP